MSAETWTIQRLLQWSVGYLTNKGLTDSPRLDAELLMAHALSVSRVYLYTHFDRVLSPGEREPFRSALHRRGQGEPIAYILGSKEFRGHSFDVTPAVLIPRPDTEIAVDTAIETAAAWSSSEGETLRILDIGTGSGCIAIALALALPHARLTAWDISSDALTVARRNALKLGVDSQVTFVCCDALNPKTWLNTPAEAYHLIISNPPYISHSERESLNISVLGFEPHSALFADDDGLVFYKQLANQASRFLRPDGKMILEIGSSQAKDVVQILALKGWTQPSVIRDLGRNDRCILTSHPDAVPAIRGEAKSTPSRIVETSENNQPDLTDSANTRVETHQGPNSDHKRAGASVAGEPVYVVLGEPRRSIAGASSQKHLEARAMTQEQLIASWESPEPTYVPLDPKGQPKRSGASNGAPIEYVTQALSGAEEELLAEYATENASDLETES
jgi:release factor glutamine methyltransferase